MRTAIGFMELNPSPNVDAGAGAAILAAVSAGIGDDAL